MVSVKSEIRAFLVEYFLYGQNDETLGDDVSLLEKGIIDSTGVLELVSFVEEKYGVVVGDDDIIPENFDSINSLVGYVESKRSNGQQKLTEE